MNREVISTVSGLPFAYNLDLDVTRLVDGDGSNVDSEIIQGHLIYSFVVHHPTIFVELNAQDMIISNSKLLNLSGEIIAAEENSEIKVQNNENTNTYLFTFESTLPEEELKLELDFTYKLKNSPIGHYGSYQGGKRMCSTKFEPTFARLAFPCVDQPNSKAIFTIQILHTCDKIAVSIMPVQSMNTGLGEEGKWTKTIFQQTPKLSTYIVAWVVGEFEYIEGFYESVPIRIYTEKGMKLQALYSLTLVYKAIQILTEYTQIPIPLPKIDLIVVPKLKAGAMENWGLQTLLIDYQSSYSEKFGIANTIFHEFAHYWFGNFVTMVWWNELYLNEGFAVFFASYVQDKLQSNQDIWNISFNLLHLNPALEFDTQEDETHPIICPIVQAKDDDSIFDNISYSKAGVIIKMFHDKIGEENFKKGIRNYLQKHQYGNATTAVLQEALIEASGMQDLPLKMKSWLEKMKEKEDQIQIDEDKQTIWWIPITVIVKWEGINEVNYINIELEQKQMELQIIPPDPDKKLLWIKLNQDQKGYYRK
ncbi:MAG: putative Aminopeptidase M1-C [Streblomastix strix]|uniref:Putative Aminopeptidase M1-C n=1 Tax=Streblomastix strix TaxID=222440 RepID=A0A5J4X5K3_9EUKA|nr:MAG: putative Aminopeptidase M1-C [Streblomastix strix]